MPYNFYAGWARQVFVSGSHRDKNNPDNSITYPAVYGNGIKEYDERHVHLVFVGTTNFAVAFAMEAAHVLHFPNFAHNETNKTRITFIDRNADTEMPLFQTRNHHLFAVQKPLYCDLSDEKDFTVEEQSEGFLDVEFEFIKGDIFSMKIQDKLSE